ncbi:integrase catalytic domain-containing protein [Trichonephila clavipes]|nr:integrase catalytic domain-containing protein [Trichonephila clavipes]
MKQKQQTKNKHSGSARARSDQWIMDKQNRLKKYLGRLNAIAFCSDIKQAFLQICLADEHKDAVRFLWSDDKPCVHKMPKLQVYRFNRVNFGVSSSPFLLAATIRHHIEKYKHGFPDTVERLDKNFYVNDLISGGNEFEEALQTSRRAKILWKLLNGPQKTRLLIMPI